MVAPFLVVIRPDCIARAVEEHRAGLRLSRVKPEAARGFDQVQLHRTWSNRTGEDLRKNSRFTNFSGP